MGASKKRMPSSVTGCPVVAMRHQHAKPTTTKMAQTTPPTRSPVGLWMLVMTVNRGV